MTYEEKRLHAFVGSAWLHGIHDCTVTCCYTVKGFKYSLAVLWQDDVFGRTGALVLTNAGMLLRKNVGPAGSTNKDLHQCMVKCSP